MVCEANQQSPGVKFKLKSSRKYEWSTLFTMQGQLFKLYCKVIVISWKLRVNAHASDATIIITFDSQARNSGAQVTY